MSTWNNPQAVRWIEDRISSDICSLSRSRSGPLMMPRDSAISMARCNMVYPRSSSPDMEYLHSQYVKNALGETAPTFHTEAVSPAEMPDAHSSLVRAGRYAYVVLLRRGNHSLWFSHRPVSHMPRNIVNNAGVCQQLNINHQPPGNIRMHWPAWH